MLHLSVVNTVGMTREPRTTVPVCEALLPAKHDRELTFVRKKFLCLQFSGEKRALEVELASPEKFTCS